MSASGGSSSGWGKKKAKYGDVESGTGGGEIKEKKTKDY